MGILSSWLRAERRELDESSGWALITQALRSGGSSPVTPTSALQIAAVFSCVRVLAESFGQLPLELMERDGRNRAPATSHPLYWILHLSPNPEMTSAELRMTMMSHLATWGNAYAQIVYDRAGRRRELWPLRPDRIRPLRQPDGRLIYEYTGADGQLIVLDRTEILHVRGVSFDGIIGYSPIGLARRAFELKQQMEEFATAFWANDARPGVVLKHPKTLGPTAQENLRRSWEERHQGPNRANRPAILEEGMDISVIGMPQSDAQFLESQKFSRTEIASIFRVPPHMIGDLERATFSNIEEQAQEFVDYTLLPWVELWKQAIARDLLDANERKRYYAHFRTQALLRGKHIDRAQFYSALQQIGAMSPNDIRELEDMNPIDGGDVYMVPLNLAPVQDVGENVPPDEQQLARAWLEDVRVRLAARIANDVRQSGSKALRNGGPASLVAWGESMREQWQRAGLNMAERLTALSPGLAIDVAAWTDEAYHAAVEALNGN